MLRFLVAHLVLTDHLAHIKNVCGSRIYRHLLIKLNDVWKMKEQPHISKAVIFLQWKMCLIHAVQW